LRAAIIRAAVAAARDVSISGLAGAWALAGAEDFFDFGDDAVGFFAFAMMVVARLTIVRGRIGSAIGGRGLELF
jgi:hypothetical protein